MTPVHETYEDQRQPRHSAVSERPAPRRPVFTDYILSLDEATGEPPDAASFERLWRALRSLLRSEVERRGLWLASPSFLGVFGWRTWQARAGGGDALDELATDCYVFIFVQRLRIMREQARRKPQIEGLVLRCVRNFLHDAQKRQDPLGYRVFSLLKTALQRALAAGELWHIGGGRRIASDTVIGLHAAAEASAADRVDPAAFVRSWNDDLLPDLLTAHGKAKAALVERLRGCLTGLRDHGLDAFRFQDVVAALKNDARARWAAVLEWAGSEVAHEEGEDDVRMVRLIQPDTGFEDRDRFDQLLACVAEGLARYRCRRRHREYLESLWLFLCAFAVEAATGSGRDEGASCDDRMPSRRALSRHLGIPRQRFSELYATLRRLVEVCSSSRAEALARGSRAGPARSESLGVVALPRPRRQARLMGMTAAAWARLRDGSPARRPGDGGAARAAGALRPGDVFMLEEGLEDAIEWVVLELAGGTVLVVPADSVPLSGSADVAIQAQDPCGPLTLRCGVGQWIDGALPPDERTGALAPEALDRARERRRAAAIGAPASAIAHQADADPSLREWLQIVLEAGAALAARRGASAAAEVSDEPGGGRRRPPVRWLALAAAVLLASTLGLLFAWSHERARNVRLGERLSELEAQAAAPLTNLPIVWLLADYRSRDQEIVRVPATAPWLILILSSPAVEIDDSGVRIELQRRDDEQPVWSHAGLRDPGTGEITLAVPRARLASGRYYVLLWHEDRAGPVAVYLLQVVMEAGP